jgi:signal peptidase I
MRSPGDSNPEQQPQQSEQDRHLEAIEPTSVIFEEGVRLTPGNDEIPVGEVKGEETPPTGETLTQPRKSNLKPLLTEIMQTILLTLIIFACVRSVVQNFKVDGASMEPTLHSGQYLLINKVAYLRLEGVTLDLAQQIGVAPDDRNSHFPFGGPQRGDIVVFRYPGHPDRDFIKRVIGLPGDTIQIDRGRVYINGTPLEEEYIHSVPTYSLPKQMVPEGSYFVLGDNRPNSSDSHIWGFVPEENLIGKAWLSYWPPGSWGPVPDTGIAGN